MRIYAIFVYRGLYWLVDDGSYPRALPTVQGNIKQQIVQVWAIPSRFLLPDNIPCDSPTSSQREETQEPDTKRRKQQHLAFMLGEQQQWGRQFDNGLGEGLEHPYLWQRPIWILMTIKKPRNG